MNHVHVGPADIACTLCFVEANKKAKAEAEEEEARRQRFWRWVLVGFSFMIAAVCAIVLWRIGMGR